MLFYICEMQFNFPTKFNDAARSFECLISQSVAHSQRRQSDRAFEKNRTQKRRDPRWQLLVVCSGVRFNRSLPVQPLPPVGPARTESVEFYCSRSTQCGFMSLLCVLSGKEAEYCMKELSIGRLAQGNICPVKKFSLNSINIKLLQFALGSDRSFTIPAYMGYRFEFQTGHLKAGRLACILTTV